MAEVDGVARGLTPSEFFLTLEVVVLDLHEVHVEARAGDPHDHKVRQTEMVHGPEHGPASLQEVCLR
tara:strand:+ start:593 stop:793 length:201 start_codon:yes stop_codon:yes gene_type:complete